jgi:hypothetical protein
MLLTELKQQPDGTYAGIRMTDKTTKSIAKWIADNDIPNAVPTDKLHTTLLYSRKHLPDYSAAGSYDSLMIGKPTKFDVWESADGDTRCLVLEYKCKELVDRHNELMDKHGATYDFDEFKPHVTVSYDIGDMDIKSLPMLECDIEIEKEYMEELDLNWAKSNK